MAAEEKVDTENLAKKIYDATAGMSRSERRVARVLHATKFRAGLESVASLASKSKVSGPTVIRFTAKLGYENYREFQHAAKTQFDERIESPAHVYRRTTVYQKSLDVLTVSESILDCVKSTFSMIDTRELDKIVKLLANERRNICTIGGQASGIFADLLAARLYQIRPGARSVGAQSLGYSQENQLLFLGRRDVVVAFDFRRYQESTIFFARTAASQGSTVVLITDTWLSPIADFARHVLITNPDGHLPYDFLTPCLALIEIVLAMALTSMDQESVGKRIEQCERYDKGLLGGGTSRHVGEYKEEDVGWTLSKAV